MKNTMFCQGHWELQRVPYAIRGLLAIPYRLAGVHRSPMHPNLCTVCDFVMRNHPVKPSGTREMHTTILFADLRGYTSLSERIDPSDMNTLLHAFYDRCAEAIWERDGIINKFIGDAVLAIFNYPFLREDHEANAVQAALDLQRKCRDLGSTIGLSNDSVGIGVGIHAGICSLGQLGQTVRDFTAIGPVVNLASRLQSAAAPGEVLLTPEVYEHVKDRYPDAPSRQLQLKGIEHEVTAFVIDTGGADGTKE